MGSFINENYTFPHENQIDFTDDKIVIYTTESGEEYTGKAILDIAEGSETLARNLYDTATWQHIETMLEELKNFDYFEYMSLKVKDYLGVNEIEFQHSDTDSQGRETERYFTYKDDEIITIDIHDDDYCNIYNEDKSVNIEISLGKNYDLSIPQNKFQAPLIHAGKITARQQKKISLDELNSMLRNFNKEVFNALKNNYSHDDILEIESKYITEYGSSFPDYSMLDCSLDSFNKMASIIKLHNTENLQKFEIDTYYNIFGREWKANGFSVNKENNDMFFGGEERNGTGTGFSLSSISKADFKKIETKDVGSNFKEAQKSLQTEIIDKIFKTGEPNVFLRDYLSTASKDAQNYLCEKYLEFEDYKNEPFDIVYERLETAIYDNGEMNTVIENIIYDIEEEDELLSLAKEFNADIGSSINSIQIDETMDVEKERANLAAEMSKLGCAQTDLDLK